jgi:thiosulfate/3-mercaptopyruvate sulfurtransferase
MIDMEQAAGGQYATLLIRAWTEPSMPHALRARLLTVDAENTPVTWSTAVGDAAISQEVLRWLRVAASEVTTPQSVQGPGAAAHTAAPGASEQPMVDTNWVQDHLQDPEIVIVDVNEERPYDRPHLPGAVRLDWLRDLQHPTRRIFLDREAFADLMDAHGIGKDSHVVLYGDRDNTRAAAAYWYFSYHGHRRLSLLDGGLARWLSERRPVTRTASPRRGTGGYSPGPGRPEILITRNQLLAGLVGAPPGTSLVDCREPAEFAGRPERSYDQPVDRHRMPGHIPGAVNLPIEALSDPTTHRLLPQSTLAALAMQLGLTPDDQVIVYCGVADRSGLVWFVLHELLGWPDVRCYVGAWAEYGSLSDVPVESSTGPQS